MKHLTFIIQVKNDSEGSVIIKPELDVTESIATSIENILNDSDQEKTLIAVEGL
jgi:hypothetical protein